MDEHILKGIFRRRPGLACLLLLTAVAPAASGQNRAEVPTEAVISRTFVFVDAPFSSAHASTIVETKPGELLAAWFGGSREGADDVEIWTSRRSGDRDWTPPAVVTSYPEMPTWNPVLFNIGGVTRLYFKIGPSPREWIGAYRETADAGRTWGDVRYLPAGLTGPVRAKPIRLSDGTLLAGTSVEAGYDGDTPRDAPYRSWAVWIERSDDDGSSWTKRGPVAIPGEPFGVIQPTFWETDAGDVHIFMRSATTPRVHEAVSSDHGLTWSVARRTRLPNPNSGLDVVRLRDGRLVLVLNHNETGRNPIHLVVSTDEGVTWSAPLILEEGPGEYSYPAVIESADGLLQITYTWRRERIRHVVIDPDRLSGS